MISCIIMVLSCLGVFVVGQSMRILHVSRHTALQSEIEAGITYANWVAAAKCELVQVALLKNNGTANINTLCSLKRPQIIIDTTEYYADADSVKRYSRCLAVPTVSSSFGASVDQKEWNKLSDTENNYLVHIRRPTDIMQYLIMAIGNRTGFDNVVIFYDKTMDHLLVSMFRNKFIRFIVLNVETVSNIALPMNEFIGSSMYTFILFGSRYWLEVVMGYADARFWTGVNYAWYFITHDVGEISCTCKNITIIHIRPKINTANQDRISKTTTLNFGVISSTFHFDLAMATCMAAEKALKDEEHATVNCDNYTTVPKFNAFLKQELKKIKNNLIGVPFKQCATSELHQPFEMEIRGVHIFDSVVWKTVPLGTWSSLKPLQLKVNEKFDDYPAKKFLKIAIAIQPPFIHRNESAPRGYSGYCIDLIEIIAGRLKFQYELYLPSPPEVDFGKHRTEFEWVIDDVSKHVADLGLGSLSVYPIRQRIVEFSLPIYDLVGYTIMMKQPETSGSYFTLFDVLEYKVWIAIFAVYCTASVMIWVFDFWSPFSYRKKVSFNRNPGKVRVFTLTECFWFCLTSLTPYGGGRAPGCLSGRLLAGVWWLFGFVIIAAYTANLAAFLTMSQLRVPVESLEDLSLQSNIKYGTINNSATMDYLDRMVSVEQSIYKKWKNYTVNYPQCRSCMNSEYPIDNRYTKIRNSVTKAIKPPENLEEAVKMVQASPSIYEGFAFIGDASDIRYAILTNCDLQMAGPEFSKKPYAIAFNKNSYLKRDLNQVILQLLNERKLEQLKKKWWENNPLKAECKKESHGMEGITLENIVGIFFFIAAGTVFALVVQFCSTIYKRTKKSNDEVVTLTPIE